MADFWNRWMMVGSWALGAAFVTSMIGYFIFANNQYLILNFPALVSLISVVFNKILPWFVFISWPLAGICFLVGVFRADEEDAGNRLKFRVVASLALIFSLYMCAFILKSVFHIVLPLVGRFV